MSWHPDVAVGLSFGLFAGVFIGMRIAFGVVDYRDKKIRERDALIAGILTRSKAIEQQAEALAASANRNYTTIQGINDPMSTTPDPISSFATEEQANLTATANALTAIATGVAALDADIQTLQASASAVREWKTS